MCRPIQFCVCVIVFIYDTQIVSVSLLHNVFRVSSYESRC